MTYQRPAYEQVTIAHGGSTVTLRPSLRAAITLETAHGFPALLKALEQGSVTIISQIILAASRERQDAAAFLATNLGRPLSPFLSAVCQLLAELVLMLQPASARDLPAKPSKPTPAKPLAWADYYADLFEKATGWLGWTPEQAWNATPTEIDRAYAGLIAKLKAIHGSDDNEQQPNPDQAARNVSEGLDPEFDRTALRALKAKIARKK